MFNGLYLTVLHVCLFFLKLLLHVNPWDYYSPSAIHTASHIYSHILLQQHTYHVFVYTVASTSPTFLQGFKKPINQNLHLTYIMEDAIEHSGRSWKQSKDGKVSGLGVETGQ